MPQVEWSLCLRVCVRKRTCKHTFLCAQCQLAASVHMGAYVSDTFLPVELVRLLMTVIHLLKENGSLSPPPPFFRVLHRM